MSTHNHESILWVVSKVTKEVDISSRQYTTHTRWLLSPIFFCILNYKEALHSFPKWALDPVACLYSAKCMIEDVNVLFDMIILRWHILLHFVCYLCPCFRHALCIQCVLFSKFLERSFNAAKPLRLNTNPLVLLIHIEPIFELFALK